MTSSEWRRLDNLLSAVEDDALETPDGELQAETQPSEVARLRALVGSRLDNAAARVTPRRTARAVRLPTDPSERRALLKLLLSRPTTAPRYAVGFSEGRDLADKDVEDLLRRLLASGELNDPD